MRICKFTLVFVMNSSVKYFIFGFISALLLAGAVFSPLAEAGFVNDRKQNLEERQDEHELRMSAYRAQIEQLELMKDMKQEQMQTNSLIMELLRRLEEESKQ